MLAATSSSNSIEETVTADSEATVAMDLDGDSEDEQSPRTLPAVSMGPPTNIPRRIQRIDEGSTTPPSKKPRSTSGKSEVHGPAQERRAAAPRDHNTEFEDGPQPCRYCQKRCRTPISLSGHESLCKEKHAGVAIAPTAERVLISTQGREAVQPVSPRDQSPRKSSGQIGRLRAIAATENMSTRRHENSLKSGSTPGFPPSLSRANESSTPLPSLPESLPVDTVKSQILEAVSNRVTIILGQPSCGKSTRVPVLLSEAAANTESKKPYIIVTAPHRIAVHGVWSHLHKYYGDRVGYRMRREGKESHSTQILFVTASWLMHKLLHGLDGPFIAKLTTIIIDEVHERGLDTDLLILLVRRLMRRTEFAHVKLLLMSATMDAGLYERYFAEFGAMRKIQIPQRKKFQVDTHYLDGAMSRLLPHVKGTMAGSHAGELFNDLKAACSKGAGYFVHRARRSQMHLAFLLMRHVVKLGSCVLVFLSGIGEIMELHDKLEEDMATRRAGDGTDKLQLEFVVTRVHPLIPAEEQASIFDPVEAHQIRVVLATEAAESSITLPDCCCVIDTGLHKEVSQMEDGAAQMKMSLIDQSAAVQRIGRTGRVGDGVCYRLYSEVIFKAMAEQPGAKVCQLPLDEVVLKLKVQLKSHDIKALLEEMLTPPSTASLQRAYKQLSARGFITAPSATGKVTAWGALAATLSVSSSLAWLVCHAVRLDAVPAALVLVAALQLPGPGVFRTVAAQLSDSHTSYNMMVQKLLTGKARFDGGMYSEPLSHVQVYRESNPSPNPNPLSLLQYIV